MGTVLGSLAAIGYDAEWHCIQLAQLAPRMNGTGAGSSLPTLTKRDARTLKGSQDRPNKTGGPSLLQTMLNDGHTTGRLNPRWCEWFMGFPGELDEADPPAVAALGNSASPIQIELIGQALLTNLETSEAA